jgi:hypothetical protein
MHHRDQNTIPPHADPSDALGKRWQLYGEGVVFKCVEYDSRRGYMIVPEVNVCLERWVSGRAFGSTFFETKI